jgi:hypothetical protein
MELIRLPSLPIAAAMTLALAGCGSNPATPTSPATTTSPKPAPTPTPPPAPTGIVLPAGMVCSPTPPPLLRMAIKIHAQDGNRTVLDASPLVPNIDHYCDRVGFGDWKFCQTRQEGDPQRVACDYLVVGIADTGRWGPTWIGEGKPCGAEFSQCVNHPTEQFLVIAKANGEFQACAAANAPLDEKGVRCSTYEYY